MDNQEYYQLLGVEKSADPKTIKESYRKLAFKFHPDRNKGDEEAASRMKAINEAYAVLSDEKKRREYDTLKQQYGSSAYSHFRQNYSEQDIFNGSDINQVFEEMARSFGFRGFDEIFKEFYGQGRSFKVDRPGFSGRGYVFFGGFGRGGGKPMIGNLGKFSKYLLGKMGVEQLSAKGEDMHDVIELSPTHAQIGGPYAYYHKKRAKKLVVKVPPGVRDGQKIRLAGMGKTGKGGGTPGDIYLKIHIRKPLIEKLKGMIRRSK